VQSTGGVWGGTTGGCEDNQLHIVDFRFKSVYSSIDCNKISGVPHQVRDSSFSAWNEGKGVEIWNYCEKIRQIPIPSNHDCADYGRSFKVRPWRANDLLLINRRNDPGCEYAVVNEENIIQWGMPDSTTIWMDLCEDITYLSGKTYCLQIPENDRCKVYLTVDNELKDSLRTDECDGGKGEALFKGIYVSHRTNLTSSELGETFFISQIDTARSVFNKEFGELILRYDRQDISWNGHRFLYEEGDFDD
jgi:hypothetical protein